jgi:hypothetical protein
MKVQVECYAGSRADEEPRVIEIDGRRLRVLGIARRWQDVDARYFQVRLEDGDRYVLRHDERVDEWTVIEVVRASS